MQISDVIQADPWKLAVDLNGLAAANEIQTITKTFSAGKFVVIYDNAAPTGQVAEVLVGDPEALAAALTVIAASFTVEMLIPTFSAAHYVVVYK